MEIIKQATYFYGVGVGTVFACFAILFVWLWINKILNKYTEFSGLITIIGMSYSYMLLLSALLRLW